jgi:hypothetical protein
LIELGSEFKIFRRERAAWTSKTSRDRCFVLVTAKDIGKNKVSLVRE